MPNLDGTPTQVELLNRLAQINNILASGVASASYGGDRSATFVKPDDLRRQRDEIMLALGLKSTVRRTVASFSGGYY